MYQILINGWICDGTGKPPFYGSVGISGERISSVGKNLNYRAKKIIDGKEYVITPGFIDIHSHSDTLILKGPAAKNKIHQGVTTEVIGNCGISGAPLLGEYREYRIKQWKRYGPEFNWKDFREYIHRLRNIPLAVNLIPLVGHGNIRGAVMGFSSGIPSKKELLRMQKLLETCLREGSWGLSTGLVYPPGCFAGTKELICLAEILKQYNSLYATHIRDEGDNIIPAIEEVVEIARTGVNTQISHLKTCWRNNWNKLDRVLYLIEEGIKEGYNIHCDRYPYTALNTDLDIFLPQEFHRQEKNRQIGYLKKNRNTLAEYTERCLQSLNTRIIISNAQNNSLNGKTIEQIAKRWKTPYGKAVIDILIQNTLDVQITASFGNEDNLLKILKKPYTMIGSDSSIRAIRGPLRIGHPHPRTFGTFPRVLSRYTGTGKLKMEEAVYKMTGLPAKKLALKERGIIRKGYYADIVVFNKKKITDTSTYTKPYSYPEGIEYVIVNGRITVCRGKLTGTRNGRILLK